MRLKFVVYDPVGHRCPNSQVGLCQHGAGSSHVVVPGAHGTEWYHLIFCSRTHGLE